MITLSVFTIFCEYIATIVASDSKKNQHDYIFAKFKIHLCWCSSPFKIRHIKHKVQYNRGNTLIILSEHVPDFHPESQSPFGHCPFTLLHLPPFKQWHILLHLSPKKPLSHTVITKYSNNEKEIFVTGNNTCSQSTQNNTISVKQMYY